MGDRIISGQQKGRGGERAHKAVLYLRIYIYIYIYIYM
jgi:hypothetical protein